MKKLTIEQLKEQLKSTLINNQLGYVNDGSLTDRVNQNIQWAWDNWQEDVLGTFYTGEKPENYTEEFMVDWIDNEDLWDELESINEGE